MAESKSLKKAVSKEVKEAVHEAKTGNVSTTKAPPSPSEPVASPTDLPTNARSHLPEA